MLWAALHFPALPVEIFTRASPDAEPFVVTDGGQRPGVVAANAAAAAAGVRIGMLLSAAYPLVPTLRVREREAAGEQQALVALALWAEQFTSTLSLVPASALLLEIGGSLRYFGGLHRLLEHLRGGIAELGYRTAIGVAPTPTGALLLARAGDAPPAPTREALHGALSRLPLALLDCSTATIDALAGIGVHLIGDIPRLPRDGLVRRFGQALIDEIDRALGHIPDPRPQFVAPPRYRGRLELPAPAAEVDALVFALKRLIAELAGWLLGRGLGTLRMQLHLVHDRRGTERRTTPLGIRLSTPSRTPDHLLAVWRERLSRIELIDRVESLVLATEETATLGSRNLGLLPEDRRQTAGGSIVDRLRARLGEEAVIGVSPRADHRPEQAWSVEPLGACMPGKAAADAVPAAASLPAAPPLPAGNAAPSPRPVWLLREPEPLGRLFERDPPWLLMDGPERIESGWWDGGDIRRDYFVARSPRGEICWVYRDPRCDDEWFLHGLFG